MHFCCEKLVDIAVFSKAEICKDKVQKKDNPTKKCTTFEEKDCCSSQSIVKTGDDIIKKANNDLQAKDKVFLNTFFSLKTFKACIIIAIVHNTNTERLRLIISFL